ncbi:MAG: nucleotide pyrophosphohydrolase [Firmicutes bacterium]|nr:nucleotide pyrophosphohydrolase [Bacillota bacterium]
MTDTETNLQEIKDRVKQFTLSRGWRRYHSPKNLAISIAIEAAELMEIFQWISTDEAWQTKESDEFEHLQEELADVLIYCMSLANQLDIDVAAAIEDKMQKNALRYPAVMTTER